MLKTLIDRFRDYADHPDPITLVGNKVALVVASNLPFYPLYLHWIVGTSAWPAWFALLTVPGFVAVPALARRHSLAGRALLPVVGVLNTVLCAKVLGVKTGVELFFLPCVLLSAILFRPGERIVALLTLAFAFASYLVFDAHLGAPLQIYSDANYGSMISLNALSVASLVALTGYLFAGAAPGRR